MEDTTTILIWFLSGTFDHSPASNANLYLTVVSGIVAAYGVAYPSVSMACCSGKSLYVRGTWSLGVNPLGGFCYPRHGSTEAETVVNATARTDQLLLPSDS